VIKPRLTRRNLLFWFAFYWHWLGLIGMLLGGFFFCDTFDTQEFRVED
jgi:hypothetical protein